MLGTMLFQDNPTAQWLLSVVLLAIGIGSAVGYFAYLYHQWRLNTAHVVVELLEKKGTKVWCGQKCGTVNIIPAGKDGRRRVVVAFPIEHGTAPLVVRALEEQGLLRPAQEGTDA